jgi:tetratricopeptide (TPR) repeat protein
VDDGEVGVQKCAQAFNESGLSWLRLGNLARAGRCFTHVLELRPNDAAALANRARVRQLQGDITGARADYDRALNCADGSFTAVLLCKRAALRHSTGDPGGAMADLRAAMRLDGETAVEELALSLPAEAEAELEIALRQGAFEPISNWDAYGHARQAVAEMLLGHEAEAADHLARFEFLAPDFGEFLEWLLDTVREADEEVLAVAEGDEA